MPDDALLNSISNLDLKPRPRYWASLTYCVLDAVWSIGSNYDSITTPLVRRLATAHGDEQPVVNAAGWNPDADNYPLSEFVADYTVDTLLDVTNHQRTSTTNGILKAEASLKYAHILLEHGVEDVAAAIEISKDDDRKSALNSALRKVPGEGQHGIRRSYLWMLISDATLIKPDRMVMRWLRNQGAEVSPSGARGLINDAAEAISQSRGSIVTPWMIDHAIWRAQREKKD